MSLFRLPVLKDVKILGVLCAKRDTCEQKVSVFGQGLWAETAQRVTQSRPQGLPGDGNGLKGAGSEAGSLQKVLCQKLVNSSSRARILRASDKQSLCLLDFSLSRQESWLLGSDFDENQVRWHWASLRREQMANILSNAGSSTKKDLYLPVSDRGLYYFLSSAF